MRGGGGAGPAFGPAPFLLGGVGAAKGLLPCFLVPKRNQLTACTLALWWLKFGPTGRKRGGGGGTKAPGRNVAHRCAIPHRRCGASCSQGTGMGQGENVHRTGLLPNHRDLVSPQRNGEHLQ